MKLYIIEDWLGAVNRALPRAQWASKLIEQQLDLRVAKHPTGKPYALDGPFINWAHNEYYLVIALSKVGEVGVDVECRTIAYEEQLHGWVLHEEEKEKLACGAPFAEIWTRKEAILKWTGEGLTEMLHELNSYAINAAITSFVVGEICITVCSERWEEVEMSIK